jgi:predicted nucleotidyltransferase
VTSLDPNLDRVEVVAAALGPLREQLVFVGGCAAGLLISDPAATPIRATLDVDLVVHVMVLTEYHRVEKDFAKLGFKRDMTPDAPICRWVYRQISVDLMPAKPDILGFANRWYPLALQTAKTLTLPSGMAIRLIDAPVFVGTKFEAFENRGAGDILASHDLEDILNVVAGRAQLLEEVAQSASNLRHTWRSALAI